MRPLLLVMSAVVAAVVTAGTMLATGNAPTPHRASVNSAQEDADAERTANIQRINRVLIEYGASQGLRQHGYENLVVVSSPEAWDDPRLVAMLLAGGSDNSSSVYTPMMLVNMGALGGDTGSDDLYAGPTSVDARLALIQQHIGNLDPYALYAEAYRRVQNTDTNVMTIGQDDPGYPYNQIAITNSALLTANAYMADGLRLRTLLNSAADDYVFALAKGEMTMTYPEYLASIKAQRWIRSPR